MKHGVVGAVGAAVAGFSLAAAVLAVNLEPVYWLPTTDRTAQASVTVVDRDRLGREDAVAYGDPGPGRTRRSAKVPGSPAVTVTVTAAALASQPPTTTPPPQRMFEIPSELGIPGIVLQAYRAAEARLAADDPGCRLDWETLAGVGKIESGHARDGQVGADGTTFEPILGPALTGGPYASISDTDDGELDGDPVWDRAVGPMQFIPGTWRYVGVDGNGDGVASPHNIFDAARSAGVYLCAGSRDLSVRASLDAALHTYNHSDSYVALVLAWIDGYRAGTVTPLPPRPAPSPTVSATTTPPMTSPPPTSTPTPTPTATTTPTPTATPTTDEPTTGPSPEPTETGGPSPEPTGTDEPSPEPTGTDEPSPDPTGTDEPSPDPTGTDEPSAEPTATASEAPSETASEVPSGGPSEAASGTPRRSG